MDIRINAALLLAKYGYYFAKCDGSIDITEENCIAKILSKVNSESDLNINIEKCMSDIKNENVEFESLIYETKELLNGFNETEKQAIIAKFDEFIYAVIQADGIIHPNETKYYSIWKNEFSI